jgi:CrcB protein
VLGGYTTFSTFAVDVVRLVEERAVTRAVAYPVGSLVLGPGAAAVGWLAVR